MKSKLFFTGLLMLAFLGVQSSLLAQKTETRNVSGFSAIEASSVFNITVNKSATESLVIEADENIMPYVRAEVKNGVLKLYLDNRKEINVKILKATIGIKELRKIKLSGACKLTSDDVFNIQSFNIQLSGACNLKLNIKSEELKLGTSGACNLDLVVETQVAKFDASGASSLQLQLKAEKAVFDMSGACKADIKGKVDKADFGLSGACSVKAEDLLCKVVSVESSGASKLELNVSERLNVNCSGTSNISYRGRPIVNSNTSGMSKVRSMD
jgi:hypothetical protein